MASPLEAIKATFAKHFRLPDDDLIAIDYVAALLAANQRPDLSESVWGYLVGPPSCGKSETLRAFSSVPATYFLDSLTANALASGYGEEDENGNTDDPSLLRLLDKKILVVEDFSPITGIPEADVAKIMGDLRQAYDGEFRKHSGKVGARSYKAHFGCLIGSTPAIDIFSSRHQQLGERFLCLRIAKNAAATELDPRLVALKETIGSMSGKKEWRLELRKAVTDSMLTLLASKVNPVTIAESVLHQLACLADAVARFRTTPIEGIATEPEAGRRIIQQLVSLGIGHAWADGRSEWTDADTALVVRVASDTLPRPAYRCLVALWNGGNIIPYRPSEIVYHSSVPGKDMEPLLQQYLYLNLLTYPRGDHVTLQLSDQALALIRGSNLLGDAHVTTGTVSGLGDNGTDNPAGVAPNRERRDRDADTGQLPLRPAGQAESPNA